MFCKSTSSGLAKALFIAALALGMNLAPLPAVFADDAPGSVSDAFNMMKAKDYAGALAIFNKAARENPDSVDAHFGRAQTLEALNRREESVKEFQLCLLLNPSAAIKTACNKELDYMTLRAPSTALPPPISEQDTEKSATKITNQASERIRSIQSNLTAYGNRPLYYRSTPSFYTRRRGWVTPPPMPVYPTWSPSFPMNSRFGYQANYLRYGRYGEDALRRSRALQESAEALKEEMSSKPSEYQNTYLSPHNTNLYVRNYVPIDAEKVPEVVQPLAATPLTYAELKTQSNNTKPIGKKK